LANKYVKILSKLMARRLSRALSSDLAYVVFAALSGRLGVKTITADGVIGRFQGLPGDMVMRGYMETGDYNPKLCRLIRRCLGGGDFIDIGANIGLVLVPISRLEGVRCFGFEADPVNFWLLSDNLRHNTADIRAQIFNIAVHSEEAMLDLELSDDNMGDHRIRGVSLLDLEKYSESRRPVIRVERKPLDVALDAGDLRGCVVIKVDTQGAEFNVSRGGARVFERADFVIAEFSPYLILRAGSLVADYLAFIKSFTHGAILPEGRENEVELNTTAAVIEELHHRVPFDGSAARFFDLLLARIPLPPG
jgi:FkbM family methyltransferase